MNKMIKRAALAAFYTVFVGAGAAVAQTCDPTPKMHAVRIAATDGNGAKTLDEFPFVAGGRSFMQALDNGWVFALVSAEEGWSIRLYEHEPIDDAVDLTSMTPPHGGAPNPRDIFGWHFRNADNTGPHDGSVNAPQELRAFVISPSLAGTGGYKPSTDESKPRFAEPGPGDGIGWLKVLDYGLTGLEPDKRARMNYLKFDACLSWPRNDDERDRLIDEASLAFTDVDRENYGACGFDHTAYVLDATRTPRQLGGDIDGDDALDQVAQVKRKKDGKRGLALCRAGSWIDFIGFTPLGDMAPEYLDRVEAWQWFDPKGDRPVYLTGIDLPQADGDILALERIEKEVVVLFWRNGALQAKRLYHLVEP